MTKEIFEILKIQRKSLIAPIDKYGCLAIARQDPLNFKFRLFVALLLSSQTKDEVTYSAIQSLQSKYKMDIAMISKSTLGEVNEAIKMVGFHNKKSLYLMENVKYFLKNQIPTTYEELIKLKGFGAKMAILYLQYACNQIVGIAVDTHVHRVSNRIGLVKSKTVIRTQKLLEKKFECNQWKYVNYVLVGFGQMICKPRMPRCDTCLVRVYCNSKEGGNEFNW